MNGRTTMWSGVPYGISLLLFFVLMGVVGVLEGMQIALLAVVRMDQESVKLTYPTAYVNCALAFRDANLEAFLVGRQILVTVCMVSYHLYSYNTNFTKSDVVCGRTHHDHRCEQ